MTTKAADGLSIGAASAQSFGTSRFFDLTLGWAGAAGVWSRLSFSVFFCRLFTPLDCFEVELPDPARK
jgi:hypothetical protein